MIIMNINPLKYFFSIVGHEALDINLGPGYNTILLQLIPGDLSSNCSIRYKKSTKICSLGKNMPISEMLTTSMCHILLPHQ